MLGIVVVVLVLCYVYIDVFDFSFIKCGDYFGIVLMLGFFGCFEYVFEEGLCKNWFGDDVIVICVWFFGICGFLFIVYVLIVKDLIVDLCVFVVCNFGIGSLLLFVIGIGIFVIVFLMLLFFV